MEIQNPILLAGELEKNGVKPYIIDDNSFFKSCDKYPRFIVDITNYDKNNKNGISTGSHGDVLLKVFSNKGSFNAKFASGLILSSNKDGEISFFEGGLPLVGQCCNPPFIENYDTDAKLYAVFEFYGSVERHKLASFRENKFGLKLKDSNETYQIVGGHDIGFNCNSVIMAGDLLL